MNKAQDALDTLIANLEDNYNDVGEISTMYDVVEEHEQMSATVQELEGRVLALQYALDKFMVQARFKESVAGSMGHLKSAYKTGEKALNDTAQAGREAEARIWEKVAQHTENAKDRLLLNHQGQDRAALYVRSLTRAIESMRNQASRLRNGGSDNG